jgi:hypothetical protein
MSARIPRRTGYTGEMRWGIINDSRRLDGKALPIQIGLNLTVVGSKDAER